MLTAARMGLTGMMAPICIGFDEAPLLMGSHVQPHGRTDSSVTGPRAYRLWSPIGVLTISLDVVPTGAFAEHFGTCFRVARYYVTDFRLKDRRAMRSRPAISTRRMTGLTDGHPSFVLQTPSPRPSR